MIKNKISVIIITGNEKNNIRDCLESVKWADEIIVVDSESTDGTVEIAKEFTENVFIKRWEGFSKQKLFAMQQAGNEWVLSLDADERVKPRLAEEILSKDLSHADGFYIRRENYFMGKLITGCGWGNDYQLRLFRKSKTKLTDNLVHEGFVVSGKRAKLENEIIHFTYNNLHHALEKINDYTDLEAAEKASVKNVTIISIAVKPFIGFLQHFFARRGFKDGIYGFFVSVLHAITILQVQTKIREIRNNQLKKEIK